MCPEHRSHIPQLRPVLTCGAAKQFRSSALYLVKCNYTSIVMEYKLCPVGNAEPSGQRRPFGDHCLNRNAVGRMRYGGLAEVRSPVNCVCRAHASTSL